MARAEVLQHQEESLSSPKHLSLKFRLFNSLLDKQQVGSSTFVNILRRDCQEAISTQSSAGESCLWLVNRHLLFLLLVGAFNPVKFGLAQMFVAI